jgi:hypothetical protein
MQTPSSPGTLAGDTAKSSDFQDKHTKRYGTRQANTNQYFRQWHEKSRCGAG